MDYSTPTVTGSLLGIPASGVLMPTPADQRPRPERFVRLPHPGTFGPGLTELLTVLHQLEYPTPLITDHPLLVTLRWSGQAPDAAPGVPIGAWDDCLGILVLDPTAPSGLRWARTRGTGDPGREPVEGRGRVATHQHGCARVMAGYYPRSHGGGHHKWNTARPAFRQVGPMDIERYSVSKRQWLTFGPLIIAAHHHTLPPGQTIQQAMANGVEDASHACLVRLDPEAHALHLELGGWTPEVDGCSLDSAVIDWGRPLSGPYRG